MSYLLRGGFWVVLWLLTLGVLDIHVVYVDGLEIDLHSWPRLLWEKLRGEP